MANKKLIVVHGMGHHSEASVEKEVSDAFSYAFNLYESLRGDSFEQNFDLVVVEYNSFFEDYRQVLQLNADNVLTALNRLTGDFPPIPKLTAEIAKLDSSVREDSFFNTHWLDVLLYRYSLLNEPIRLKVAEAIGSAVAEVGSANVHVLGHSLGTSVVHDTLAKAYGSEPLEINGKSLKLLLNRDRLGGVHQVANVSRVLQSFRKVGSSEVRPGSGCCGVFVEYRHKLDPFTRIKPFDPTDNEEWIPHGIWRSSYQLVEPTSVTAANVHTLGHYLKNPLVHLILFRMLFGFRPNVSEKEKASDLYLLNTVREKSEALRNGIDSVQNSEGSVAELLLVGKKLKDLVEQFREIF